MSEAWRGDAANGIGNDEHIDEPKRSVKAKYSPDSNVRANN